MRKGLKRSKPLTDAAKLNCGNHRLRTHARVEEDSNIAIPALGDRRVNQFRNTIKICEISKCIRQV